MERTNGSLHLCCSFLPLSLTPALGNKTAPAVTIEAHTHTHARMHTHMHTCAHMYTRSHTHMYTHSCTHMRTQTCTHILYMTWRVLWFGNKRGGTGKISVERTLNARPPGVGHPWFPSDVASSVSSSCVPKYKIHDSRDHYSLLHP